MSSVLLVHAVGGPPLEYSLPKVAAHAEVHLLALAPPPEASKDVWLPCCASVTQVPPPQSGTELVETITGLAGAVRADAVLTLSEFAVVAVARACRALGLAGAGTSVEAARDKRAMRAIWRDAAVPVPAFAEVRDEDEVREAFSRLNPPLLLKSAWSAGSTAHVTVTTPREARSAWRRATAVTRESARDGYGELHTEGACGDFLLEEIVTGTTDGWYDGSGWGDYVSVEGIVADGAYQPLCVSGRLPTVPPFTERASVTPADLPDDLQRRVEEVSRAAVDALGLDTCATHTEVKLGAEGRMWVIETAARFGGVMTLRQAEEVFGLDMIGMLVRQLLGEPVDYPEAMLVRGQGAAASLVVLPVDSEGRPWTEQPRWDFSAVDWGALLAPGSRIEAVRELSMPDGTPTLAYDPAEGGRTRAAVCFLTGDDAATVLADCHRVVDALPSALTEGCGEAPAGPSRAVPAAGPGGGGILDLPRFERLCGLLAGHPYVKVVVDRHRGDWHILDSAIHAFHAHYIASEILGMSLEELYEGLDGFNHSVYQDPGRRFLLGVISLHHRCEGPLPERFMVLETVEADTMGAELLSEFHAFVRRRLDDSLPLYVKPANHGQEASLDDIPEAVIPRVRGHELFAAADFVPLNPGEARGRLRWFPTAQDYRAARDANALAWYDIVAMPVVPDDIPRVTGLVNACPTTPLSHTNVLAAGWGIPNAVVRDIADRVERGGLDNAWVRYRVSTDGAVLAAVEEPDDVTEPHWHSEPVRIGTPRVERLSIVPICALRSGDRHGYGTKAANLGELHHVLRTGSPRLTGYYRVPRPPRANLLGHLADRLGAPRGADLADRAAEFLAEHVSAPEGIAVPFEFQQRFLASSPELQQRIGMLKMALELDAFATVDGLCAQLEHLVRTTPLPDGMVRRLHDQLVRHLAGSDALVVRSSSNAEDLPGFSAAGVYDSVSRVSDLTGLVDAVRNVWASLFSARSVRLRHQAGIPLDDTYMGVIVQHRHDASLGGVMVTCNPTQRADFRNVCVNCVDGSAEAVVEGATLPMQYLYNTVEGGGRTVSLGAADEDLGPEARQRLAELALAGRLLQGHFSEDLTFAHPLDIEWLTDPSGRMHMLQVRTYTA
ncbi:PEP/pyruvate-binding domain-containing protein [Wenjunlia tyrosinilytica]|uniref:ATP-grasp domain-containing protein n=1 Tax=Wenjunlia tyrosinilytica TaxID=1544741 RepID=A0A917ZP60_9ACTN|nr:PEP/pyruvate-binding domain-containing protein [Wenjunlia tyrosinilytica]GGO87682.1 hypothetical protein GCM10012280_26710 [Wenjunlia tyrosinilytica]